MPVLQALARRSRSALQHRHFAVDQSEMCATSRKPERERAADTAPATSYHSPSSHQVRMHNATVPPGRSSVATIQSRAYEQRRGVNGRRYRCPRQPCQVITVDGGDPRYFDDALERGLMPARVRCCEAAVCWRWSRPDAVADLVSAATTLPNPAGAEEQLVAPSALRAPPIYACLVRAGAMVLVVSAKDQFGRLLAACGVPSVSAERAAEF